MIIFLLLWFRLSYAWPALFWVLHSLLGIVSGYQANWDVAAPRRLANATLKNRLFALPHPRRGSAGNMLSATDRFERTCLFQLCVDHIADTGQHQLALIGR